MTTPNEDAKPSLNLCIRKTLREVRCQSWGILLSHPFQGEIREKYMK